MLAAIPVLVSCHLPAPYLNNSSKAQARHIVLTVSFQSPSEVARTCSMEKETPAKKAAAPSVSQINAEYVTQVNTTLCLNIYCLHAARKRNTCRVCSCNN